MKKNDAPPVGGFFTGVIVGALLGLLFAPEAGATTRATFGRGVKRVAPQLSKESLISLLDTFIERFSAEVSPQVERARKMTRSVSEKASEVFFDEGPAVEDSAPVMSPPKMIRKVVTKKAASVRPTRARKPSPKKTAASGKRMFRGVQ